MGWDQVKVNPSSLAIVKRQAISIENRYVEERKFLSLKSKYRGPVGSFSQHGCGGDHSGKAKKKKGNNTANRVKVLNKLMVKKVNGLTGHFIMEEVK